MIPIGTEDVVTLILFLSYAAMPMLVEANNPQLVRSIHRRRTSVKSWARTSMPLKVKSLKFRCADPSQSDIK